jgi:hypothetical protein
MRSGFRGPLTAVAHRPGRQSALPVSRRHGMTGPRRRRGTFSFPSDNRNTGVGVRFVGPSPVPPGLARGRRVLSGTADGVEQAVLVAAPVAAVQAQQEQKRTGSGDET